MLVYLFPSPLINEIYFTFRSTVYSEKLIAWWTQLQTSSCWPETVTMDSKRLFIFIALWLFLSCVLLDHAEGFTIPRKRKRQQQKKRDPNNQLSRRLREMVGLASQIWVCILKMISCPAIFKSLLWKGATVKINCVNLSSQGKIPYSPIHFTQISYNFTQAIRIEANRVAKCTTNNKTRSGKLSANLL